VLGPILVTHLVITLVRTRFCEGGTAKLTLRVAGKMNLRFAVRASSTFSCLRYSLRSFSTCLSYTIHSRIWLHKHNDIQIYISSHKMQKNVKTLVKVKSNRTWLGNLWICEHAATYLSQSACLSIYLCRTIFWTNISLWPQNQPNILWSKSGFCRGFLKETFVILACVGVVHINV